MKRGMWWAISSLAGWAASCGMVMAQSSVDCGARSTSVVDRLVCNSPSLLALDAKFGRAYAAARDASADKKAFLARAQADLAWRQQNCRDSACVEEWFNNVTPQYQAVARNSRSATVSAASPRGASASSLNEHVVPKVLAAVMSDLYAQNSIAADELYRGKELLIEVQVLEVSRDHSGDLFVVASGGYYGKQVVLMFSKDQQSKLVPLRRWATSAFNCRGVGDQGAYVLVDCRGQSAAAKEVAPRPRGQVEGMLNEADRLSGECRGGMPANPRTSEACKERDLLMTQIEHAGWCWGHAGEAGYQRKWVECRPGD